MRQIVLLTLVMLYINEIKNVSAQDPMNRIGHLVEKFQHYSEEVPGEEVYVMTDRETYIAGETLWFKAWLICRKSSALSSSSKIIYCELVNPENKLVVQKRLYNDKGSCLGQFNLPDALSSGTYTIRAYTSWMKNFIPDNCFMKDINIYNAHNLKSFRQKIYTEDELTSESEKYFKQDKSNTWLTIDVKECQPDTLELIINVHEKPLSRNPNLIYLIIQTHGNLNYARTETIVQKQTGIKIPKNLLIPGINQISVFDSLLHPVCVRYIYTPGIEKPAISIQSADTFGTRSKVTLELKADDPEKWESPGLCISVVPLTAGIRGIGPEEYMIFGSEFGRLPGRVLKGKKIAELPREILDSLLLQLKSNQKDWMKVLSGIRSDYKDKMKKEEHFLSGVLLTNNDLPAGPGEIILLSVPGKVPQFNYTTTDQDGKFSFSIPFNKEMKDLILQPDNIYKNFRIRLLSSFSDSYPDIHTREDSTNIPLPPAISQMDLNHQVSIVYGLSSADTVLLIYPFPLREIRRFYGKPDFEIELKEWMKLHSVEEIFFEIVPNVSLKKTETGFEIFMTDPLGRILFDTPPVMMIDGVIIRDPDILAGLDPEEVEKIDVVKEQYMVGDYLFNGIVNVITKPGDLSQIPIPDYALRIQYRITDTFTPFISPDYSLPSKVKNREPDFRNTLYWNPDVRPDEDGKAIIGFWTSDIRGDYEVCVQGITADGKGVYLRKKINVK